MGVFVVKQRVPSTIGIRRGPPLVQPVLLAVSPNVGFVDGGDTVTLSGYGLLGATSVLFGTSAATLVSVSDTQVVVSNPPGSGAVAVTVSNAIGSSTLANAFTYTAMIISNVYPSTSQLAGGIPVTITGKGFTGATGASLNGVALTAFFVANDTTITGITGANSAGVGVVAVTNASGTTSGGTFEYWDPTSFGAALLAAWDMSSGVTIGTGVASVANLVGGGNPLAQGTGANQPTYVPGDAAYSYNATIQWPAAGSNVALSANVNFADPYAVVMVCEDDLTATNDVMWWGNGGAASPFLQYQAPKHAVSEDNVGGGSYTGTSYVLNKPSLVVDVRNGASSRQYINGVRTSLASGTLTARSNTQFILGNVATAAGANGPTFAKFAYVFILGRDPTAADLAHISNWCAARFLQARATPSVNVVFTGNSIVRGNLATNPDVEDFVDLVKAGLPVGFSVGKDGNPGAATSGLMDGHTGLPLQTMAPKQVFFAWEITNDIGTGGVNGATAYANMQTWIGNLQKAGLVISATCLPRGGTWTGANETARTTCNANLLSGATAVPGVSLLYLRGDGSYVLDLASVPQASNPANTTYYASDQVHPTAALHAILAQYVSAAVQYVATQ